jgi:peptidyl-prolyl cis-trans isomerase D
MIRFLQTDNRITKALLVVVIGAAAISMCVYLIPGLTDTTAAAADTYAVVYPHWYSRFTASGETVTQTRVTQVAEQQLAQQGPQYANNPIIVKMFEQQVGTQLVEQKVLLAEAAKLGIHASDNDVRQYLHSGPTGAVIFPDGKYIGDAAYAQLISDRLNMSVADFESGVKEDIVLKRLQSLITAGVTVNPQEVRDTYRKNNIKIKFDYAVLSADDVGKSINPSDSDLEAFFKKNAASYATAVPEQRTIQYFSFTPNEIPGGIAQPTQQEIQAYYTQHQADYQLPEQSRARHILVTVAPGADAKTDAAAKAKAEGILKQLQAGGNWDALAKQNSDDPGSKDKGGELGFAKRGQMVPEFDNAIFTQKINDIGIVKSQFGYHVVQVEERQTAHAQPINEVLPAIQATLIRQKTAAAEQAYAEALTAEAAKNGMEKTAAAHHLQLETSAPVAQQGVIPALPSSTQLLAKAFQAKQGAAPEYAPSGEGDAIFQVTGVIAAHSPSFADWKEHVLDDYRTEQLPTLLAQKTSQLAEQAKSTNDLAKAAKAVGATMKSSDLVGASGQVPDIGQLGQVAPQLFDLNVGAISAPIDGQRTGVVAKIVDKQEPTADEIAKNFDATRDSLLNQRQSEAFNVFLSGVMADYKKRKLIRINAPAAPTTPTLPGM